MDGRKLLLLGLIPGFISLFPLFVLAQNTNTLTTTSTSNNLSDNGVLGCPTCSGILAATDPFPDTSTPIFRGNVDETLLPPAIAKGLPPDNQFGAGTPAGGSDFPLSVSTPFSQGTFINSSNDFSSTPVTGGNSVTIGQNINQVTPGGTAVLGVDQQFSLLFSIQSLTDPDGNLVGLATGTFDQVVDGVPTSGTVQFDTTNGFSGTNLHQ